MADTRIGSAAAAYAAQERIRAELAATKEANETLAALAAAIGEPRFPDPSPFTHTHIRALVRSAFFAGIVYAMDRADEDKRRV